MNNSPFTYPVNIPVNCNYGDEISLAWQKIVLESGHSRGTINHISQLLAKVSSIELLQRQVVKSLFYDYLNEFINATFSNYEIKKDIAPTEDRGLVVDYKFDVPQTRQRA